MSETVVSLRKFSREAPGFVGPVLVVHEGRVLGEFTPRVSAPRTAQDDSAGPVPSPSPDAANGKTASPARSGAPRTRAASGKRNDPAPGGAPRFRPAPKPGAKR